MLGIGLPSRYGSTRVSAVKKVAYGYQTLTIRTVNINIRATGPTFALSVPVYSFIASAAATIVSAIIVSSSPASTIIPTIIGISITRWISSGRSRWMGDRTPNQRSSQWRTIGWLIPGELYLRLISTFELPDLSYYRPISLS